VVKKRLEESIVNDQTAIDLLEERLREIADLVSMVSLDYQHLMMKWYRHGATPMADFQATAEKHDRRLSEILMRLQMTQSDKKELLTLLIIGEHIQHAHWLWDAYFELANLRQWRILPFVLKAYDPLLDPESREYAKRYSGRKKPPLNIDAIKPEGRLLGAVHAIEGMEGTSPRQKLVDYYRLKSHRDLENLSPETAGIALQIDGHNLSALLKYEQGIHHFLIQQFLGNPMQVDLRVRTQVWVQPGRLLDWVPASNWRELSMNHSATAQRSFSERNLILRSDLTNLEIEVDQVAPTKAWIEMIMDENHFRMWQEIGYRAILGKASVTSEFYETRPD
jgi:hypothetical protein